MSKNNLSNTFVLEIQGREGLNIGINHVKFSRTSACVCTCTVPFGTLFFERPYAGTKLNVNEC